MCHCAKVDPVPPPIDPRAAVSRCALAVLATVVTFAGGADPYGIGIAAAAAAAPAAAASRTAATLDEVLSYPYADAPVTAARGAAVAWVRTLQGVRNIWVARAPAYVPLQVTRYTQDDGQELTGLVLAPDGSRLLYVRGGAHDANWPAAGNLAPNPANGTAQPLVQIWEASLTGAAPRLIADGDEPALSSTGRLAFIRDHQVWTASLTGAPKPTRLLFDRGKAGQLAWSPDGRRLAFVSDREDHSFIALYESADRPIVYLAPSTGRDGLPTWSPDGKGLAFVRLAGAGGAPVPMLKQTVERWALWVADVATGAAHLVWKSPATLAGSFPDVAGHANLHWMAGDRLAFLSYLDDWPHLYSVPVAGGEPLLLTPGAYMVEHVSATADGRTLVFDANHGTDAGDAERRHVFTVPVDAPTVRALTSGAALEWAPVPVGADRVAFVAAGTSAPPAVAMQRLTGGTPQVLHLPGEPDGAAQRDFVVPRSITFTAADGVVGHGQLFAHGDPSVGPARPGVLFLHGGPPRQMMLGWHYMDYYSNSYALNQYLAARGFVVLAVNYRLGIGYGRAFHQPEHAGPAGAAEYQDVVAAAKYLGALPGVDPKRIGSWGGSYGGYLTALALARNSDLFAAGVDLHGVHDWSRDDYFGKPLPRYEQGDRAEAMAVAFKSSPIADVQTWRSPVLLVHGDDDRNVPFNQTVDLVQRLEERGVRYEELVIPNDIHGFLTHANWLAADRATAEFLERMLRPAR